MRHSIRGNTVRLKHINRSGQWPSGNPRCYYRPKGGKAVAMPDLPLDHPRFLAAYAALAGEAPKSVTGGPGSIAAGVTAFLRSDVYSTRSASTRAIWRRGVEDIRERYGAARLVDLQEKHIRTDLARFSAHAANNRLKVWRAACKWWTGVNLLPANPAQAVSKLKPPNSQGHIPWVADDCAKFRARWPLESAERLAFELLQWAAPRMSDAVAMTERMIDAGGWLTFSQQKTGGVVSIPLRCPPPVFADVADQAMLLAAMDARPVRHLVLMVTAFGKPRSGKAASAWFSAAARKAGVVGKSAHGLRKMRATMMAERGATAHQLAAWLGHESLSEVAHYARSAQRKLILAGPESAKRGPTVEPLISNNLVSL